MTLRAVINLSRTTKIDYDDMFVQVNKGVTDTFENNGRVFLAIWNQKVGTTTIQVTTPNTFDGLSLAQRIVIMGSTSGNNSRKFMGPFPTEAYNSGGLVTLVYDNDATNLHIAVLKFSE